jgi:hypothetical protein
MPRTSQSSVDLQKNWEDKISRAKKVRTEWKNLFRVDLARDFFEGKQNPGYPKNEWITINKLYSHLKSQLPALYSVDPYFYVKLKKSYQPDPTAIILYEQRGKIRQAYLNYLKEELKLKEKMRLAIQDAHFAYGILKVYYHADEVKNPDGGQSILGDDGMPMMGENGPLIEPEYIPTNERYCISRVHPDDFLWDEDAGPLEEDWNWVAQCRRRTMDEIKNDRRYTKAKRKALVAGSDGGDEDRKKREERKKGGDIASKSDSMATKKAETDEEKIIYEWEIYDLKKKKWLIIAEGADTPIVEEEELPPGVKKHPFSILRFTFRDDSPYPIPPLSQGIDPQKEYNLSRSQLLTHRKRFNRKYEAYVPALEDPDSEITKMESGEDGTIIRKNQPIPVITPINDAPLDQTRIQEIMLLNSDMIELFGGSADEARGIAGADSATQAGILDRRLEMKEGDHLSMVIDAVIDVGKNLDRQVQTHITKDEAILVIGPQGQYWELVKARDYEEIQGEFQYSVNVGSTIPRLPQMERSQWMAFLQVVTGFPALLTAPHFMKRMAELFHIEDEAMVEELRQIGIKIMQGAMMPPKPTGSVAGAPETKPQSVVGGQAGGPQSLMLPMAGNAGRA